MAEECRERISMATTSSVAPGNWWDLHGPALSSWCQNNNNNSNHNHNIPWQHLGMVPNPNSNNSDEDVSMSNHSSLTVEPAASSTDNPASDTHIWSQVYSNIGSNQEVGENFLDMLSSSKSIFESDYLKKLDGSTTAWDNQQFSNPNNNNNNNFVLNNQTDTKLSNLISTWSIAPPESAENNRQFLSPLMMRSSSNNNDYHNRRFLMNNANTNNNPDLFSSEQNHHHHHHHQVGLHIDNGSSNNIYENMINSVESLNPISSGDDIIYFSGRSGNKSIINKPCGSKSLNSPDSKKQGHQSSSSSSPLITRSIETKKKRSENTNNSETNLKKPKQEGPTTSSVKAQGPKVKLGDKITALQQIVSPFGKTDTASVLYEAIQYIKFLEEQVQLFSNPYIKTNSHKDHWGSLERKANHLKGDHHHNHHHHHHHNHHHNIIKNNHHHYMKVDLKSRGLCLVPISSTPQVYQENTGSDFWTPTYRGCLYR